MTQFRFQKRRTEIRHCLNRILVVFLFAAHFAPTAFAACTNPAREEGTVVYETNNNVPMYCNGTDWIAMGALNPSAGGPGCTGPNAPEGKIIYNTNAHVLQYCDGDDWRAVGGGCTVGGCNVFTNFDFTDTVAAPSTLIESDISQIDTNACTASVSITGDGSPEFRTCTDGSSDANCDASVVQDWATSGDLTDGEYLQLRLTSNDTDSVVHTATVTVGSVSQDWSVTATGCDMTPTEFTTPGTFSFTVPIACNSATIEAYGAGGGYNLGGGGGGSVVERADSTVLVVGGGGGGGSSVPGGGGGGGFGLAAVSVTPSENLTVYVGGAGANGCSGAGGDGGAYNGSAGTNNTSSGTSTYGGTGGVGCCTAAGDNTYGGGGGNSNGTGGDSTYGGGGGADNGSVGTSTYGQDGTNQSADGGGGGGGAVGDTALTGVHGDSGGAAANGGPGSGATSGSCNTTAGNGKVVIAPGP